MRDSSCVLVFVVDEWHKRIELVSFDVEECLEIGGPLVSEFYESCMRGFLQLQMVVEMVQPSSVATEVVLLFLALPVEFASDIGNVERDVWSVGAGFSMKGAEFVPECSTYCGI